jgi:Sleepless protein
LSNNKTCDDPFVVDKLHLVDCDEKFAHKLSRSYGFGFVYCVKTKVSGDLEALSDFFEPYKSLKPKTATISKDELVYKSCGWSENKHPLECTNAELALSAPSKTKVHISGEACICTTDACNGSGLTSLSHILLIFLSLACLAQRLL